MGMSSFRFVLSGLALALLCQSLLTGCASRIRVRENWHFPKKTPIDYRAAAATWHKLEQGKPLGKEELADYNEAVRDTVSRLAYNWKAAPNDLNEIPTNEGNVRIQVNMAGVNDADLIDHLVPADFVKIRKGLHSRTIVKGVGSSMVARRKWSESDPMVPKTGLWFPLTAYLNFDVPGRPVLSLKDPTRQSGLRFAGKTLPFAANYSAFIAQDFRDRQRQILDVPALFRFAWFESRMGLYRLSEFDPNKEPCVLVHGINSSPLTWNNTINEMLADKEIRERYEFWTFGYPTGAPISYLAMRLREDVDKMSAFRERNGAASPKMVVVAHSMGGLLAKTLTQHSGDENWNQIFTVPLQKLKVSEQDRELLRKILYFEPHQHIDKMIFIATPHKGSDIARTAPAQIVSDLIQAPQRILHISKELLKFNSSALTPLGLAFVKEAPNSLEEMRTNSKMMKIFSRIPLSPEVRYFSIIGDTSPPGTPLEKTSDNVVPYPSAHLEQAESEKVIHFRHAVHKSPEGIAEIIRILKLD